MEWRKRSYSTEENIPEADRQRLDDIAAQMRVNNPGQEFVRGEGAVWLRDGDVDYGMYSWHLLGQVVQTYDFEKKRTVLSRCVPCGEPGPPFNCQKQCPVRLAHEAKQTETPAA